MELNRTNLDRVTRVEQSVHELLSDPKANQLTKPMEKEWKVIDSALQHLRNTMQSKAGDGPSHAPRLESFKGSSTPALPARPQSAASRSSAHVTATRRTVPSGSKIVSEKADPDSAANTGSLDSMLHELEMALRAAQAERDTARNHRSGQVPAADAAKQLHG